jgi:hypothetical protein
MVIDAADLISTCSVGRVLGVSKSQGSRIAKTELTPVVQLGHVVAFSRQDVLALKERRERELSGAKRPRQRGRFASYATATAV